MGVIRYEFCSLINKLNFGGRVIMSQVGERVVYKVFYKNYNLKKGELMGVLVERRKDLRGRSRIESGLRWAKLTFGHLVKDKQMIFIVPDEMTLGTDAIVFLEKGILTQKEFGELMKGKGKQINRKKEGERSSYPSC
jgi:hypothetical protein